MKKASGVYYSIINPNSFLFTLIIIFILIFGAASIIAYKHYKNALLYAIAENKSTANLLSMLIYEHQKAATSILESYAQRPLFIDAIQKKDFHHVIYHLKSLNEHHVEMDALFISDQYGTVWANYPVSKESYGKNLAYRDWYKGVSKKWRPYISTVFRLIVLEKDPAVAVSVPVFDRKGKVIGILGSTQRTLFLATFIRANTLNPRKSITLLDQEGNIIYGDTVDYQKEITKYLHFSPIQEAIRNGKNILEISDPVKERKEELLAFSTIRDMGWTVIVSEEKGAILRSETTYFIEIFAMAFLLFVCMTIAPLLLRRDYQYREMKEHLTQEKKLRESEVRYKELFENMYVGIAVYEAIQDGNDFIFKDFNEGGEKIDNVKRGDIIGKKVTEAFPGVAELGLLDVFRRVWKTGNPEHHSVGLYKDQRISGWRENYVYKLPSGEIVVVYDDVTAQKQAEAALRESEEKYRNLVESISDVVYAIDSSGVLTYISPVVKNTLGYEPDELIGRQFLEFVHKEDHDFMMRRFSELREGIVGHSDYRVIGKQGDIKWVRTLANPIIEEGGFVGARGVLIDITERKKAEEALRESKEFVENLIASIQDGFSVLDSHGVHIDVNPAFCQMTGFSREELIGVGLPHPYWPPEAYEEIEKAFQKTLRGEFGDLELTFMWKNGERFPVIVSPSWVKDKQGNVTSYFATVKDITERKRAEEALRESEARYRSLFDGVPIGLYRTTPTGQIMDVNPAMVQMVGYPNRESMLATNAGDGYANLEDRIKWQIFMDLEGIVRNYEKQIRRRDAKIIWVEENARTVRDTEGRLLYYEGSFQDITERKQAEKERGRLFEQVRTSRKRLRNLSRRLVEVQEIERRDLVRKLHDEVGQNLTALSINLNIVHSELPRGTVTKTATRIDDSLKLVEETVERIRDVMTELRPPVLDDYGISAALYWYGKQFSERTGITTVLNAEDLKPRLSLPMEMALFRIAQEALTNVAKYAHAKNVKLRLEEFGESVHLSIIDDGIGFDLEAQYQAEAKPGWGLINMIERAWGVGGHLSVETAKGKGTQIVAEVPRSH